MPTADDMSKLVDVIMVNGGDHAYTLIFYIQIAFGVDVPEPSAPPPRTLRNRFTLMTCVNFYRFIENSHTLSRKPVFLT